MYSGAVGIMRMSGTRGGSGLVAQPDTARTIDKRNNDTSVFMSSPPKTMWS